jgi:hypothetical protein
LSFGWFGNRWFNFAELVAMLASNRGKKMQSQGIIGLIAVMRHSGRYLLNPQESSPVCALNRVSLNISCTGVGSLLKHTVIGNWRRARHGTMELAMPNCTQKFEKTRLTLAALTCAFPAIKQFIQNQRRQK